MQGIGVKQPRPLIKNSCLGSQGVLPVSIKIDLTKYYIDLGPKTKSTLKIY